MAKRQVTIKAIDVVKCIRSGMDDAELTKRFNISARTLQAVLKQLQEKGIVKESELHARMFKTHGSIVLDAVNGKLPSAPSEKPIIEAAEALRLVRSGMDDATLMNRYDISAKGLQSLFKKLVAVGALTQRELEGRSLKSGGSIVLDESVPQANPVHGSRPGYPKDKIAQSIKSGMTKADLVEEYGIRRSDAEKLVGGLVDQGLVTQGEFERTWTSQITKMQIMHRLTGKVIYDGQAESLADLVAEAASLGIDLSHADLAGSNLARLDLAGAILSKADLTNASLMGTDLTAANLSGAILASANMYGAILDKANLADADLSDSDMTMVHAVWVFMPKANLSEAILAKANLAGAHMAGVRMFEAVLSKTNLEGAYLDIDTLEQAKKES
jgi:uncharacterized protein (DUF433 family)